MARKYLIPDTGRFFKANMHCHSTFSDGSFTVEQLREEYMKRGYSIIAFTDHNTYRWHKDLDCENFLALCGYEVDICDPNRRSWNDAKVCHLCLYDKHPADGKVNRVLSAEADYNDKKSINAFIKSMNDEGFLVCYNHPAWSLECCADFLPLEGMFAMEVFNTGCALSDGLFDYNSAAYEEMLRAGKRLFPIASDDNHDRYPIGSVYNDSFGGYIQIKAEKLEYNCIMTAIEKGDFYASTGAEIDAIYLEDGKICLDFPKARAVYCRCNCRNVGFPQAEKGEYITHAEFNLLPEMDYVRFEVVDTLEKVAYTRAFTRSEIGLE